MDENNKQIDPAEVMESFARGVYSSQVGYALAEIEASNFTEAQKQILKLDLITAEYENFLSSKDLITASDTERLNQLKHLQHQGGQTVDVLTDSFDRFAGAVLSGNIVSTVDVYLTVESYRANLEADSYGDAFAEAAGVLAGSIAAKVAISAGYTGPITAVATFLVGFTIEWGLKETNAGQVIVEFGTSFLSRAIEELPLELYGEDIAELLVDVAAVSEMALNAGVDGVEALDAFLNPIFENWVNGVTLNSAWNDWEFAAHDVFDHQPTFANAESITSPIIIDLDADGIETTTLNDGVYFDHDGNGLAEKTAWAGADDGMLALDRNGDGVIDSGAELFGNNTHLADGSRAANGFEALAELDSNGDGLIDSEDQAYTDLRIWRDANQDGMSQIDELLTLNQAGVSAIATGYQATNLKDSNGNQTLQAGMATLTDGTEVAASDVWFRTNLGLTKTADRLELSEAIQSLPTAQGFGNLHNLDQAMARDSQVLTLVEQYVSTGDPDSRRAQLDGLIYQWAGVQDVDPHSRDATRIYGHVMDARQLETLEELVGEEYLGTWCWGERDPNPHGRAAPVLIVQYQDFAEFVWAQLEMQTAYADLFDQIGVRWDSESLSFKPDTAPLIAALETLKAEGNTSRILGVHQVLEALGTFSSTYTEAASEVASAPALIDLLASNLISGTAESEQINGSSGDDLIHAKQGDDQIGGGAGNDTYLFNLADGSDAIYDSAGSDSISFGEGIGAADLRFTRTATELLITRLDENAEPTSDQILIRNLFDFDGSIAEGAIETLRFKDGTELNLQQILQLVEQPVTEGDDQLYGTSLADSFDAGLGSDTIYGGAGDDLYRFELGDGADVIFEHSGSDTLSFGPGIGPESLQMVRTGPQGEDILIQLLDEQGVSTADSILIRKAYQNLNASDNQIEWLRFDEDQPDAPPLALLDLVKAFGISDGDDQIYGFESDDRIDAGIGHDQIHAAGGNDELFGGAGDDQLFGEAGDDHLSGGAGNDLLDGGSGSDIYHFAAGMGHDRIRNQNSQGDDSVQFDASISARKLVVSRLGDDLLLSHNRNAESILLENFFDGDSISTTAVDKFLFADGHPLDINDIAKLSMQTTQGDDYVTGLGSDDLIAAQGGNDLVFGGGGDDSLFGDQGNDQLYGDAGNDQLYGGAGQDQLIGGLGADSLYGGAETDDLKGNAGADELYGERGDDQLFGGSQNDWLDGGRGNDQLSGDAGDDYLLGGKGMDLLIGGQGDDKLDGGQGNDTYLYRSGDGNDQILQSEDPEGFDILAIENFATDDLWLTQRDDDLIVSFRQQAGSVQIDGWFSDTSTVDAIEIDQRLAYAADIERMVEAMVAFDAAQEEEEVASAEMQLNTVIQQSWHERVE